MEQNDTMELMTTKDETETVHKKAWAIYAKIKDQYEPQHKGKYLAIEVESGMVHMEEALNDALWWAQERFGPGKSFYCLRIGYDYVETIFHALVAQS
jgi:hypothetical protein